MSLLKAAFEQIDVVRERKISKEIRTPEVAEFIEDLKRLQEASNGHLNFIEHSSTDPWSNEPSIEVVFGNNKSLNKFMKDGRADNLLTINFLRGSLMRVNGVDGYDGDESSVPKDRGALAAMLAVFLNERVKPDVLLGVQRKLNFA